MSNQQNSVQPSTLRQNVLRLLVVVCATGVSLLQCCQEPPTAHPVIQPPKPTAGATVPAPRVSAPVSRGAQPPAVLEKPRLLGPVTPAIVVTPAGMREPLVRVKLTDESDRPPTVRKGAYHGRIETLTLPNGKYVAINVVPMDAYLAGVLPKEILNSWEPETFRAQAIVARTFALYQILTNTKDKQWDVSNDVSSQMYGGIAGETAKSRAAVAATRGQVLTATFNGQTGIFCSRYSACAGGATQDPSDAWGDVALGVLTGRRLGAIENISPSAHFSWPTMYVTKADIDRCVRSWGQRNNLPYLLTLGPIRKVTISKRNASTGRPTEMLLTDATGRSMPIRAEEFRLALLYDPEGTAPKPFSSYFDVRDEGAAIALVNGHGYGHGIGMSQWGAQALALQGRTHTQILAYFYPGASLKDLW